MSYINRRRYSKIKFMFMLMIIMLLIIVSAVFGAANITIGESFRIMVSRVPLIGKLIGTAGIKDSHFQIIYDIRLPRILLAGIVGAGLSVVGAVYQGIFKNPMADPYMLGISSGSALGASIAIVLRMESSFFGVSGAALMAFVFAILTTLVVYNIARVGHKVPTAHLLLAGITVSFFLSSVISILMIFNRDEVEKIVFWTMGSLSAASWNQVLFLAVVNIPLVIIIMFFSRDINIMLTGEETSRTLGIDSEKVKILMLLISSVIVAATVSVSGIIGFIGLIIPHAMRMLTGSDNRVLIPASALAGIAFLIIADTLARTLLAPSEIPVGAITSLFGAPYFIYLLYQNKKKVF